MVALWFARWMARLFGGSWRIGRTAFGIRYDRARRGWRMDVWDGD